METPRLTQHARERCKEMGISTKVAKRIVQCATLNRAGHREGCVIATCTDYPAYAVVHNPVEEDYPIIVTVLFNTDCEYVRNGAEFIPIEEGA